jgi:hypothetical protein
VQSLSGPFLIAARFAEERAAAGRLPSRPFDPCIVRPAVRVDKYQTVSFDNNRYSVPRAYAFGPVTVKGYVDRVVVVADGQVVAAHARCYGRCPPVLDPLHYLATLGRKPAALDHAPVYRDWKLPAAFAELRAALEERHGAWAGARQFIRVLELLRVHPQARVERAIVACRGEQVITVEAILQRTRTLAAQDQERGVPESCKYEISSVPEIRVPRPDLGRFNQLLSGPARSSPGRACRWNGEPCWEGGKSYEQECIPDHVSRDRPGGQARSHPRWSLGRRMRMTDAVAVQLLKAHLKQLRLPAMGLEFEKLRVRPRLPTRVMNSSCSSSLRSSWRPARRRPGGRGSSTPISRS